MKPGIYSDITNADYHGGPGVSKSGLDLIRRSPLHYKAVIDGANDNEPTAAQSLGTAAHALILEPDLFYKEYCLALRQADVPHAIEDRDQLVAMVAKLNEGRLAKLATGGSKAEQIARIIESSADLPEILRPSAAELESMKGAELKAMLEGANAKRAGLLPTSGNRHELAELLRANGVEVTLWSDVQAEWQQNNGHRTILSQDQWDQLHRMRDAVMAHPAARGVLERGQNVVVDLKTTDDASLEGFARSIAKWRYDVQHPFYLDVLQLAIQQGKVRKLPDGKAELSAYATCPDTGELLRVRPDFWRGLPHHFVFIAVEKGARVVDGQALGVGVYRLDDESVQIGRAQYKADLAVFAACKRTGIWPGYGDKIQLISVPAWHASKNAHLLDSAA